MPKVLIEAFYIIQVKFELLEFDYAINHLN